MLLKFYQKKRRRRNGSAFSSTVGTSSGTGLLLPRATVHMNNTQPNNTGAPTYWREKGPLKKLQLYPFTTPTTTLSSIHTYAAFLYGILHLWTI
jgi:hypothetical protein